jgi:hypothetical protein
MSTFCTPSPLMQAKTASYTILPTDDGAVFTITAAATATLPATSGTFGGLRVAVPAPGQGIVFVQNAATSTATVTIAAASGDTIFGNSSVAPGQLVKCKSDGAGTYYCSSAGASATGNGIQMAAVPLTSASILALNTTPLSLIASPGSGKATKVLNIGLKMTTTSTVYTGGGALEFRYTNGSGTKVSADIAAAVITTTAGTSYTTVMGIEASLTLVTAAAITVNAASADFAAGTGTGTFYLLYTTIG